MDQPEVKYYCEKCKLSVRVDYRAKNPHIGVWCRKCGSFIRWIDKEVDLTNINKGPGNIELF